MGTTLESAPSIDFTIERCSSYLAHANGPVYVLTHLRDTLYAGNWQAIRDDLACAQTRPFKSRRLDIALNRDIAIVDMLLIYERHGIRVVRKDDTVIPTTLDANAPCAQP